MFDRFMDGSRKSMGLARQAALRLGHAFIGTEHLLLGLLELDGPHHALLARRAGSVQSVREALERRLAANPALTETQLPFTPHAKRALELTCEEVERQGLRHIAPEHLLLGLVAELDGIAGQVLRDGGLTLEDLRAAPGAPR